MKLIVGLGNPGAEYVGTRHNFGFFMLDQLAAAHGAGFHLEKKFSGEVASYDYDGERVYLLKPTTFYNLVGEAAQKVMAYYHIDISGVLVIHDEMALPLGTIRTRLGGSDAGNNGIKNLINVIGPNFARVRIGSGQTATHDGDTQPDHDRCGYVLGKLNQHDGGILSAEVPTILEVIDDFVRGKFTVSTYRLN